MIRIYKNDTLVNHHIKKIYPQLTLRIDNIIKDGGLKSKVKKKGKTTKVLTSKISKNDEAFLTKINTPYFLKKIIGASPFQLKAIIRWSRYKYPDLKDNTTVLYKCVYNIFITNGYNQKKNIDKYSFIKNIGLQSCPYCNRNYIYTLKKNRNIKAEIDHFYPKDLYPILGVSYFNLIPSCQTCNGLGAKSNNDTYEEYPLKNPYEIESNDFVFDFKIKTVSAFNPITNIDIDSINIFFSEEIEGHNSMFGLDLLYAENRDIVLELYLKIKHEYTKEYIEYLHSFVGLKFSDDEIYRFITCGYLQDKDLHKRPMSKLIKDVSIKLGLIRGEQNK